MNFMRLVFSTAILLTFGSTLSHAGVPTVNPVTIALGESEMLAERVREEIRILKLSATLNSDDLFAQNEMVIAETNAANQVVRITEAFSETSKRNVAAEYTPHTQGCEMVSISNQAGKAATTKRTNETGHGYFNDQRLLLNKEGAKAFVSARQGDGAEDLLNMQDDVNSAWFRSLAARLDTVAVTSIIADEYSNSDVAIDAGRYKELLKPNPEAYSFSNLSELGATDNQNGYILKLRKIVKAHLSVAAIQEIEASRAILSERYFPSNWLISQSVSGESLSAQMVLATNSGIAISDSQQMKSQLFRTAQSLYIQYQDYRILRLQNLLDALYLI